MDIESVASVAVITTDAAESRRLYVDALGLPLRQLEFELADPRAVADGADELRARGYELLHDAKEEPWGQTVARLLSPEGVVVGLSYAPSLHQ